MNKKTLNTLLAGAVAVAALGAGTASVQAMEAAAKEGQEKCYGVVKAGMNGCGAADKSHGCATMATEDASGVEWISLPTGTCEKLANGSLTPVIEAVEAEEKKEDKSHDDHDDHKEKSDD